MGHQHTDRRSASKPKRGRPALRWHGGKWMLAPWIIEHFPQHRVYVEPYGGAASVLLRKKPCYAEIYNDLDDEVVTMFRVLREPDQAQKLITALELTPFARVEFNDAYVRVADPVEMARRLVIRSFMGFGSDGASGDWRTGFRANSNRSGTTPAHDWANFPDALRSIVARLHGVVIEKRSAIVTMKAHDSPQTLHYVDPPYLHETRSRKSRRRGERGPAEYRHEMNTDQHVELLEFLKTVQGMVVLSGYRSPLYDDALTDWHRIERAARADGARARTEVLWISPRCWAALHVPKPAILTPIEAYCVSAA